LIAGSAAPEQPQEVVFAVRQHFVSNYRRRTLRSRHGAITGAGPDISEGTGSGVGKPLALALHPLPAGNLTFAGGIERSVANLDLTLSLVMADDQAIGETRDLVSLNECGAEPQSSSSPTLDRNRASPSRRT
jgi:hypothetical protein